MTCHRCGADVRYYGLCSSCAAIVDGELHLRVVAPSGLDDWDAARTALYSDRFAAAMVAPPELDENGRPIMGRGGVSVKRDGDVWVGEA